MEMQTEPWRPYYDYFAERAGRIPKDAFERETLLFEAAHDAYQTSTNQLTASGWEQERALMIGRLFGTVVKEWVQRGDGALTSLETSLREHYLDWAETP
jgi:hypothetical protein